MLDLLMFMVPEELPEKEDGDSDQGEEKSVTQDEDESPSFPRWRSETKDGTLAKGEENP